MTWERCPDCLRPKASDADWAAAGRALRGRRRLTPQMHDSLHTREP